MKPSFKAIVNHIIKRTNEWNTKKCWKEAIILTPGRVNKLLYLCQVEFIKEYNTLLFDEEFYTWPSGPVIIIVNCMITDCIRLQKEHHIYPMLGERSYTFTLENDSFKLDQAIINIIDNVLLSTNNITTEDLEKTVKSDGLWEKFYNEYDVRHKQTIPNDEIIKYYKTIKQKTYFIQKR